MRQALFLQCGAALLLMVLAGCFAGARGAISAGLAGGAALLPNLWFAWRLTAASKRPGVRSAMHFLAGELVKVGATVVLLVVAVRWYPNLHWPSFLLGLLVVLQASFLAFWKKP
ncbi:MAG: ATP synthase subunit I [Zoogloeaceae bacterium]|jgi:ATP synthase protein I|nr:ATP synthase subunit I [Zoogloeaceae bacterium]